MEGKVEYLRPRFGDNHGDLSKIGFSVERVEEQLRWGLQRSLEDNKNEEDKLISNPFGELCSLLFLQCGGNITLFLIAVIPRGAQSPGNYWVIVYDGAKY